ncbi:cyclic pyranopterin monophosphate synthase MoaC [Clostridia bacterium]|nr:cyclic pyranopterin monophosphate synthase MoaC [Clostridia bacterium]
MEKSLSHLDQDGKAYMVDVGGKAETERAATAKGEIYMNEEIISRILSADIPKGDVLSVGRIAGIMGAKKTSELIPMCHPMLITSAKVELEVVEEKGCIEARATVKTKGVTGVEMEALTAVSISLLAIYDMCKAIDKSMEIGRIRLMKKTGGKSGTYERKEG